MISFLCLLTPTLSEKSMAVLIIATLNGMCLFPRSGSFQDMTWGSMNLFFLRVSKLFDTVSLCFSLLFKTKLGNFQLLVSSNILFLFSCSVMS